ncbi:CHC2 zinc finger domain-containing protein [Ottowia thiooxydans]|uniref:Zinc finger CHC2-type domain-containing protein n=1 Tax=Ottowia thiooxydans TaxID=219182 RepID=A0ABV2Q6V2_9BURK
MKHKIQGRIAQAHDGLVSLSKQPVPCDEVAMDPLDFFGDLLELHGAKCDGVTVWVLPQAHSAARCGRSEPTSAPRVVPWTLRADEWASREATGEITRIDWRELLKRVAAYANAHGAVCAFPRIYPGQRKLTRGYYCDQQRPATAMQLGLQLKVGQLLKAAASQAPEGGWGSRRNRCCAIQSLRVVPGGIRGEFGASAIGASLLPREVPAWTGSLRGQGLRSDAASGSRSPHHRLRELPTFARIVEAPGPGHRAIANARRQHKTDFQLRIRVPGPDDIHRGTIMIADSTIEAARVADLVGLITARGVELNRQGSEYKGLCPFHSESTPSFTVVPAKGFYHCFGCGEHGDTIDFVMQHDSVPFHEAVQSIVGNVEAISDGPEKKRVERAESAEEWTPITPIPDDAPEPTSTFNRRKGDGWEKLEANMRFPYHDGDGRLLGYVCRFDLPSGGKDLIPQSYCVSSKTGAARWKWHSFAKPRPLYGLDKLASHPDAQIIFVEGEKKCDVAQARFESEGVTRDRLITMSWPGGVQGARHADWTSVYGRKIGLWPDADQKRYKEPNPNAGELIPFIEQPGTIAMLDVYAHLAEHCQTLKFFLPPSAGIPDGWDLADELPVDFDLLLHLKSHAMNASDVQKRFSLTPSISLDDKIRPVWLVPSTDPDEIRRAEFAAEILVMKNQEIAQCIDPRGVILRPYGDLDGLRVAIKEVRKLLPDARLYALIPLELGNDAVKLAHDGGATVEVLQPGESWVSGLWAQAGMKEPPFEEWDDLDLKADVELSGQALVQVAEGAERMNATSPAAQQIADAIERRLCHALDVPAGDTEAIAKFGIDVGVIARMIAGAFWSGSKSKVFLLNQVEALNQFHAGDAFKFLVQAFGNPVKKMAIADMFRDAVADGPLTKDEEKALKHEIACAVNETILDHLKYWNQRDNIEWRTDMFAEHASMSLIEDKARIALTHKPFEVPGGYEQAIIADYKQHFTRFEEFLEFLVMSRFARDRKKCYLWILADSDWGKGFLLGVLKELGLVVETSMKEIEAMFEGKPVGRTPEEFKRAFALVVDEFKTVKSELKQLQSEITLSPKNKLVSSVEIFAKIFLSAESVGSLVTSHGIEDQFANRMSIFKETGSLDLRPMFNDVGKPRYFNSVLAYTAATLNRMVAKMQAMGKLEAQTSAERWVNGFIRRHGLDTLYERFSDSLPQMAADALPWLYRQQNYLVQDGCGPETRYYLTSAKKVLDDYISMHFDPSEAPGYRKKKDEILKLISADGRGVGSHRIGKKTVKCVLLQKVGSQAHVDAVDEPAF